MSKSEALQTLAPSPLRREDVALKRRKDWWRGQRARDAEIIHPSYAGLQSEGLLKRLRGMDTRNHSDDEGRITRGNCNL